MSSWHGGKGSTSRISDKKAFDTNYDNIFRKKVEEPKSYCLFLDSIKTPKYTNLPEEKLTVLEYTKTKPEEWVCVASKNAFIKKYETLGIPKIISIENDLTSEHRTYYGQLSKSSNPNFDPLSYPDMGIHALRNILFHCRDNDLPLPQIILHTYNDFARVFMVDLIESVKNQIEKKNGRN